MPASDKPYNFIQQLRGENVCAGVYAPTTQRHGVLPTLILALVSLGRYIKNKTMTDRSLGVLQIAFVTASVTVFTY